jgi:hypothetical protein
MSQEALNEEQFEGHLYHGTATNPSTHIHPQSQKSWIKPTFPSDTDPDYTYATRHAADAWSYAEKAWHSRDTGVPRVFRVRPTGPVEKDPAFGQHGSRSNYAGDVRSKHPMEILGEEEMPERMGKPEEWR